MEVNPLGRWSRGALEALVIVGSILLAFGIDAWWETRTEHRIAVEYIGRLEGELSDAVPSLQGTADRVRRASAAIDTLLLLDPPYAATDEDIALLVVRASRYEFNEYSVSFDQTYQEMLATGTFGLIADSDTRAAITGYYRRVRRLVGNLEVSSAEGHRRFARRVRGAGTAAALTEDEWSLDPSTVERLIALLKSEEVLTEMRFARNRLSGLLFVLDDLIDTGIALTDHLAERSSR